MADHERVRRQQVLRMVEGYLELVSLGYDFGLLAGKAREPLVSRALGLLRETRFYGSGLALALLLEGQAWKLLDQHREAIAALEHSAELDPNNIHVWLALGWCHKRTGRLDLAIESLEEALSVEEGQAIVHYNLACYWSLAGNTKLALTYLAQAFELEPEYRERVAGEPDFDPIRHDPDFQALTSVVV